nr:MAG TPA: hypothetical protein [Inoviridae sp.]
MRLIFSFPQMAFWGKNIFTLGGIFCLILVF